MGAAGFAGIVLSALIFDFERSAASSELSNATQIESNSATICALRSNALESDFYSEMSSVNARMHQGMEIVPSGSADRDFVRMMIPHHQAAIEMALVQLKFGRDERLRRIAQSIIVEQGQEIAYMRSLLDRSPSDDIPSNLIVNQ